MQSMLIFFFLVFHVHGKKAKELKQGVRLEMAANQAPLPKRDHCTQPPLQPPPTAMLCSFRESEMYITMTVEHAQFKKANTAVHVPFSTHHTFTIANA